jgi:hypothetical protein
VGNHGTRLLTGNFVNLNQNDLSILSMGDKLLQQINNASDAAALGVKYPYPGFQGTVAQALRPYPQFQGIGDPQATVGESDYNSLQVKASSACLTGWTSWCRTRFRRTSLPWMMRLGGAAQDQRM